MAHAWGMTVATDDRAAGTAWRGLSRAIPIVLLAATLGVAVNVLSLMVASAVSDHDTLAFYCNDDPACVSAGTVPWPIWTAALALLTISVAAIVLAARQRTSRRRGAMASLAVVAVLSTLPPLLAWHG